MKMVWMESTTITAGACAVPVAMIVPWFASPFVIFALIQYFRDIPYELDEAALLGGYASGSTRSGTGDEASASRRSATGTTSSRSTRATVSKSFST